MAISDEATVLTTAWPAALPQEEPWTMGQVQGWEQCGRRRGPPVRMGELRGSHRQDALQGAGPQIIGAVGLGTHLQAVFAGRQSRDDKDQLAQPVLDHGLGLRGRAVGGDEEDALQGIGRVEAQPAAASCAQARFLAEGSALPPGSPPASPESAYG